jgi:hypothetical protein
MAVLTPVVSGRRYQRTSRKPEPKWKLLERVVASLERTVSPDARVEHDVQLPDLQRPGATRQCDVVVTTGQPPRETRTIVEVQRRGRKVELVIFQGWVLKMRDVGAQHLICVSMVGFPKSVMDHARLLGPTVRLVTLHELEEGRWPADFAFGFVEEILCDIVACRDVQFLPIAGTGAIPTAGSLKLDEPCFLDSQGASMSLNDIARRAVHKADIGTENEGTSQFRFRTSDPFRYTSGDGTSAMVRLDCTVEVRVSRRKMPVTVHSYEQVSDADPIAWLMRASGGGDEQTELQVTYRAGVDGRLIPGEITYSGFEPGDEFSIGIGANRLHAYAFRVPTG